MTRESLLGTFEQMVLSAVLQVGEGAYPPLVLEWLVEATGRDVNRGSLYVTLDRLEKKGLLRSSQMFSPVQLPPVRLMLTRMMSDM